MRREQLSPVFDWKRIESTDDDIASFDPRRARQILFLSYLIRDFEEHLLVLKNAGCVWGPVHSSIGQEALAAAAIDDKVRQALASLREVEAAAEAVGGAAKEGGGCSAAAVALDEVAAAAQRLKRRCV